VAFETPELKATVWWQIEKSTQLVLMELIKLAYYAVRYWEIEK